MHVFCRILPALAGCLLSSCQLGPRTWEYEYKKGTTAVLHGAQAVPPAGLPPNVLAAIQAGNDIAGKPYKYGGGHRSFDDSGYDCSGAVSYVLRGAGQLTRPTTSNALRKFGKSGEGKHITIYARRGHAFIVVAGLRFDTGYQSGGKGPHWTTRSRPLRGFKARHPPGL
jgi:cell wall-associated NlpC family hydrolase